MSERWPTTPTPYSITRGSIVQNYVSVAQNLRTIRSTRGGQRWKFDLAYRNLTRAQFAPLEAFINNLQGRFTAFEFIPADLTLGGTTLGSLEGIPLVDGADQTGRTLNTKGWDLSETGLLKAGDFIRIAGSPKQYQITADADSDASGEAALSLNTELVYSHSADAIITADNVFTVALDTDTFLAPISIQGLYSFSLQLTEVLS